MDVTIVGTGNMGRVIRTLALAGGHRATLIGTTLDKAQAAAAELSGGVQAGNRGRPDQGRGRGPGR